jgi:predicted RNA-binding Zn ribbon-like protein
VRTKAYAEISNLSRRCLAVRIENMDLSGESKFYFLGNNPAIDFANTLIADISGPVELMQTIADLIEWAARIGLVLPEHADRLLTAWAKKERKVIAEAAAFRSMLHELFHGVVAGLGISDLAISALNERIRYLRGYSSLVRTEAGFEKRFTAELYDPKHLFAPIAASAADLICFGDLNLVKKCENANCVLVFYDTTKNHSRRWCSMSACGNRAKANAFYSRKQGPRS